MNLEIFGHNLDLFLSQALSIADKKMFDETEAEQNCGVLQLIPELIEGTLGVPKY